MEYNLKEKSKSLFQSKNEIDVYISSVSQDSDSSSR